MKVDGEAGLVGARDGDQGEGGGGVQRASQSGPG